MKATVCSMLPWAIYEHKVGLYPSVYRLPKVDLHDETKNLTCLVVEDGTRTQYLGYQTNDRTPDILTHIVPATQIAKAICEDYIQAKVAVDVPEEKVPALFWFEGEFDVDKVRKEKTEKLEQVRQNQLRWFKALCEIADNDWNKYHNHRVILDDQRIAASVLQLEREWNIDPLKEQMIKCSACRTVVSSLAVLCPNCKFIMQPGKYKKESFATV
jgi:hypothetical protein